MVSAIASASLECLASFHKELFALEAILIMTGRANILPGQKLYDMYRENALGFYWVTAASFYFGKTFVFQLKCRGCALHLDTKHSRKSSQNASKRGDVQCFSFYFGIVIYKPSDIFAFSRWLA
jgi:hypothetical protein